MTKYATIILTVNADDLVWLADKIQAVGGLFAEQPLPYFDFAPDLSTLWEGREDTTEITLYDFNAIFDANTVEDSLTVEVTALGEERGPIYREPVTISTPHLRDLV